MSTVPKRTFFFAPRARVDELRKLKHAGAVAFAELPPGLEWRLISELNFSSMPTGAELSAQSWGIEEPVRFTGYRDAEVIFNFMINLRGTYRWACWDRGTAIPEGQILSITVEPCHTYTNFYIVSDIEKDINKIKRRKFNECFRWIDDRLDIGDVNAAHPADAHVIAGPLAIRGRHV
jgi:hypothetical protein